MIALLQRVSSASVSIEGQVSGSIGAGLLVFVCAVKGDGTQDIEYLIRKVSQIRIFEDESGKMNRSVAEVNGSVLIVSQFTLAASTRKGNRPSFENAASPDEARHLYETLVNRFREAGIPIQEGKFGAMMDVSLVNDGPVTIWMNSRE